MKRKNFFCCEWLFQKSIFDGVAQSEIPYVIIGLLCTLYNFTNNFAVITCRVLQNILQNVFILNTIPPIWLLNENFLSIIGPRYFVSLDIDTSLFISAKRVFSFPKQMLVVHSSSRLNLLFLKPNL